MRILLTGATGFVGQAVAAELARREYDVVGLARSESSTDSLLEAGLDVHRGDIADPASVTSALSEVDAVIHTAFNHDFSRYAQNCEADGRLLNAMAKVLEGTNKPLIATSATVVAGADKLISENDPALQLIPRSASEVFLEYADRGVRASAVRLPPSVHGAGDTAFVPGLIALARERGVSAYIGDGTNRWPAVHRDDAARLFCDALEQSRHGALYHAVAETGIEFRAIAEAIGEGLGLPSTSISTDQADTHFGWLAMFAALDNPASSQWTQDTTGWSPQHADLISDIHNAGYFAAPVD